MENKDFAIIMISIAGLCLTISVMMMNVAIQGYDNQNQIAISKTELILLHNQSIDNTELNTMVINNNLIVEKYGKLSVIFAILTWVFVAISFLNFLKKDFIKKDSINQGIESDKIKNLFLDMFRGYPNYRYRKDLIENVIITDNDRKELISSKFLLKEPVNDTYTYRLGPNALPLISAWKTEKTNLSIIRLTWILIGLGLLAIIFSIYF